LSELRLRTLAAFMALGVGFALAAGACRDVVAGDSVDAAAELCARLTDCFPDAPSCEGLASELSNAAQTDREQSLASFGELECLSGGCGASRSCLDLPAFCELENEPCQNRFDCCNWSYGLASCESGACCKTDGASCSSDNECCDGKCLPVGPYVATCGGVLCKNIDKSCDSGGECCSGHCLNGSCSLVDCFQREEPCETTDQCCREEVQLASTLVVVQLECNDGVCSLPAQPTCAQANEPCIPEGEGCCEGQGSCQIVLGGLSVCSTCAPALGECSQDFDCCSGRCLEGMAGSVCAAEDCVDEGNCQLPTDCCNGVCVFAATGVGSCAPCLKTCHNPCDQGDPIASDCDGVDASALTVVLQNDPTCECQWDGICAGQYAELVGACQ
jgi:hypothetical protein